MRIFATVAFLLCFTLLPMRAAAQQQLFFDQTFEHTADNLAHNQAARATSSAKLKSSHLTFALSSAVQPSDWTKPVNYAAGKFVWIAEVLSKPSDTLVLYSTCISQPGGYTCGSGGRLTTPGPYMWERKISQFYVGGPVDWTQPFSWLSFVARDGNGKKLDIGQGFAGEPDFSAYFPITMRVRIYAVAPGATFVPPDDQSASDGGAVADATTPYDGGASEDAGMLVDASRGDAQIGRVQSDGSVQRDAEVLAPDPVTSPVPHLDGGCAAHRSPPHMFLVCLITLGLVSRTNRRRGRCPDRLVAPEAV